MSACFHGSKVTDAVNAALDLVPEHDSDGRDASAGSVPRQRRSAGLLASGGAGLYLTASRDPTCAAPKERDGAREDEMATAGRHVVLAALRSAALAATCRQASSPRRASELSRADRVETPLRHESSSTTTDMIVGTLRILPAPDRRAEILEVFRAIQGPVLAQPGCARLPHLRGAGPGARPSCSSRGGNPRRRSRRTFARRPTAASSAPSSSRALRRRSASTTCPPRTGWS